jgi:hypothetical protein
MAGNVGKFLDIDPATGRVNQVAAASSSAGAADANKLVKLDSGGKLDATMMPAGLGSDSKTVLASEAIPAGALVNVYNNAGTLNVRKADATAAGKEANGFCVSAISSGQSGLVYFEGTITGASGLTPGGRCYTSAASPGAITQTPPSASGNVIQFVGVAVSATEVSFEAEDGVILA